MGAKPLKKLQPIIVPKSERSDYKEFNQLDGTHPWMEVVPEGFVAYKVRKLNAGKVTYFNFALAKEMGLIASDHDHDLKKDLESKLLETFSIQIINEYDEKNNVKIDPKIIKPNLYMASRYLQLQHQSKKGKTSGDGRGIWNGIVKNRNSVWDVSSRGTGVTCLAPGAVAANRPLKTGGHEFGYGCGQAEIDELYASAISAEVMHLQGIPTERVLCIVDLGKGVGIGVRAAQNLIRPAHLFLYLKQNRFKELKASVDYLISRQSQNSKFTLKPGKKTVSYDDWADYSCNRFAQFTALLDIDYIFAWLDWDGDNVLADAGIIDYGSVRQFGIRHDRYRYDDVERFSTNLNEQRTKAKYIVQCYVQIADYLKNGKKRPLKDFAKHPTVLKFNKKFNFHRSHRLLYRMGFNQIQRDNILKNKGLYEQFDKCFSYFERAKVKGSLQKVADGVNHPALFNMRVAFRNVPKLLEKSQMRPMEERAFFKMILSSFAKSKDASIGYKHYTKIQSLQKLYIDLIKTAAAKQSPLAIMRGIIQRSEKLNSENRITGNALIQIVFELIDQIKKGLTPKQIQQLIDQLICNHLDYPEVAVSRFYPRKPRLMTKPEVFSRFLDLLSDHKEDI